MRPIPTTSSREDGQATVEFAMVLFPLCLILFALVEFGLAFWNYQQLSSAASEGARRGAVSRVYSTTDRNARVTAAARSAVPQLTRAGSPTLSVSVATPQGTDAGDPIEVTVRYPETISVMGINFFSTDLTVQRTARMEQ